MEEMKSLGFVALFGRVNNGYILTGDTGDLLVITFWEKVIRRFYLKKDM